MRQAAEYETKTAYLCYDFGYDLAVKWFGQEAVDALPKNKAGKTQGSITWNKCIRGGYHPYLYSVSGRIEKRKGSIVGKDLFKTDWHFSTTAKKMKPTQTLISESGDPVDSWAI